MKSPHLLARSTLAAALLLAAAVPAAQAQTVVDWSSASSGTLPGGVTVSFSGGSRSLVSDPAWVNTVFNPANMALPVGTTEGVEFVAAPFTSNAYTVTFSSAVSGVMLHLGSLASTLTFDRPVTKLSGQSGFVVAGNAVTGTIVNSGPFSDANGSIYLGDLQSFTFSVSPFPNSGEGIGLQIVTGVTAPIPEPATVALMLAGLACVGARARRRGSR